MADLWLEPYQEAIAEFPVTGPPRAQFEAALRFARRAPSIHNTQPWRCLVTGKVLEVHADDHRRLSVADPDGRWLLQSVGTLLEFLHVTLRRFGFEGRVDVASGTASLVGTVALGDCGRADPADQRLFDAIAKRRTNRRPFEDQPVPDRFLDRAARHAAQRGARLGVLSASADKALLADWVTAADRIQMADPAFRKELARWLRPIATRRRDGIPAISGKAPPIVRAVAPLLVRTFDVGDGLAAIDRKLAKGSPAMAVLWTRDDRRADWIAAGRALARALLSLAADGIAASFLNQAVEVPSIRRKLESRLGGGEHPQAVLRLGIGPEVPPTPRRDVGALLK